MVGILTWMMHEHNKGCRSEKKKRKKELRWKRYDNLKTPVEPVMLLKSETTLLDTPVCASGWHGFECYLWLKF